MGGELIGRTRELARVVRACRRDGGSSIALTGGAGVGKSRLLARVEAWTHAKLEIVGRDELAAVFAP